MSGERVGCERRDGVDGKGRRRERRVLCVRASVADSVPFNNVGKSTSPPQVAAVAASSAATAVEVEDPSSADLVVDQPPKAEPLPSPSEFLRVMPDSLHYEAGYLGGMSDVTKDLEDGCVEPTAMSYLTRILTSKVYDVAIETPLELAPKVSERLGVQMLLKREDMQPVCMLSYFVLWMKVMSIVIWYVIVQSLQ